MRSPRLVAVLALAVLATTAGLAGQGGQQQAELPQIPDVRGTLTISPETVEQAAEVQVPDGFAMTLFAGPPVANYPACVTATNSGVVFVCVDRNGSLQADEGMGYVARLVDTDQDGRADEYTIFAQMDSPRGAVFDGDTLYVSHPPFVTAHRDTDGDGVADEERTLVRGLGFGLDFRGADHTTNGLELGIDGWLYVAVGDYGAVKATGADGQEIQMRGGGNVRVRTDGSGLEIYSRGTRNDYDVAIDPYLNLFARGNTNDGGGFDIRLYHFVAGATYGYPTLFLNFPDEVVPPLADYGAGSGTGMLYVRDPALPAPYGDTLYSVDWGRNAVYRHELTRRGSTFDVGQEEFVTLTRPTDMAVDGRSHLYVASWAGGQFRYAGVNVGYLVRLTPEGVTPLPAIDLLAASDAVLVEALGGGNLVRSREAQAELVRRGPTRERVSLVEGLASRGSRAGRVAAIFTLKRMAGADANAMLTTLAQDPNVRAFALRALADRLDQLRGVPQTLFVQALTDPDPRVVLEGIAGLRRMGATDAADALLPLIASSDRVIANVAVNALVALEAIDEPLAAVTRADDALAAGALRVLQQIHQPAAVNGLLAALDEATQPGRRAAILQALARLHYRDGVWRGQIGEWWGTRPDTTGPYYDPVAWEQSARIRGRLLEALLQAAEGAQPPTDVAQFLTDLQRNRVLPPGAADLLTTLAANRHAVFPDVARALVGRVRLDLDQATSAVLAQVAGAGAEYRAGVVQLVVAAGPADASGVTLLAPAAVDPMLGVDARAAALTALASANAPGAATAAVDGFAMLAAQPSLDPALDAAWAQYLAAPGNAGNLEMFRQMAASGDDAHQRLAYAVLLQLEQDPPAAGRGGRGGGRGGGFGGRGGANQAAAAARLEARQIIEAAWNGAGAANLMWAVGRTSAVRYRDRVEMLGASANPAVRTAATDTLSRLAAAAPVEVPASEGPVVASIPAAELPARVSEVAGDAAVGRTLFTRQGCATCHTTSAAEPPKGPFLGGILARYSQAEVLESILQPSARLAQGFATNWFITNDNRQLSGFVVREGQEDVVIRDITGTETTLLKSQIAERGTSEVSTMPPGLAEGLTLQELASLLAFLDSTNAN